MGKKLEDQNDRIVQRSIGFNMRQIIFFSKHPEFKPDTYCRKAIDEQIKLVEVNNEEKIK